jgi:hypothetical protein
MRSARGLEAPPDEEYGDRAACELLMAQIQRTRWSLQQRIMLRDELQQVSMGLRPIVRYTTESSSIPEPSSLVAESEHVGTRVLIDNAWNIQSVLA